MIIYICKIFFLVDKYEMKIHRNINKFKANNPVITVGTFDGVHLGHTHIFNKLKEKARLIDGETVVVTFWPHPKFVLQPDADIKMINTIDEKIDLIQAQGIDHLVILEFSKAFAKLSSCNFIDKYLHKKLNIKALIVGYDHHFGKDREGNFEVLKACANQYNFSIDKVDAFMHGSLIVSSTLIRNAVQNGEIEKANTWLSKKYFISGEIVGGKKIGRNIGFPTANIYVAENYKMIPASGVYVVEVSLNNKQYAGMLNIGYKPTVNNNKMNRTIEVHILNFEKNIYNENISVLFHKKLRDEKKFSSLDELKQQLKKDKKLVGKYFNLETPANKS